MKILGRTIKIGDQQLTSISGIWGPATVTEVEKIGIEGLNGLLIRHRYEDADYDTQDIFVRDGAGINPRLEERRNRSGMPVKYANCTGKDVDWSRYAPTDITLQKKIVNAFILKFEDCRRGGRGLYFYSNTRGSGKTMIACATANEVLKLHDISVKFISVSDYIELVKKKDDFSVEHRDSITNAGLLILDDIGTQAENRDWITEVLFQLIDNRCKGKHPTIFTSNVWMWDLKTDSRISERIYEVSIPVVMPEINVRRKLADEDTQEFLKGLMKE